VTEEKKNVSWADYSIYSLCKVYSYWVEDEDESENKKENERSTKKMQKIVRMRYNRPLHSTRDLSRYIHNSTAFRNRNKWGNKEFTVFDNVYESDVVAENKLITMSLRRSQDKYLLKRWLKCQEKWSPAMKKERGMQENGPDATERDKDNDDKGNGIVNTKANGNENINENINTLENEHEQDMKKEEMIRRGLYLNTEIKNARKDIVKTLYETFATRSVGM